MATHYSYKAARYGTGNMGKIRHATARKHAIKLYTQDLKIAKQHYDALKQARTGWSPAPDSQVPKMVPNPGNPLQFTNSTETPDDSMQYLDVQPDTDGRTKYDPVIMTHERMGDFHNKRSMAFLEAARLHTELGLALAKEQANIGLVEAEAEDESPLLSKLPSMFEFNPDPKTHDPDKALDYHQTLYGEAIIESHGYRIFGEQIRKKLDDLGQDEIERRIRLREALEVCRELYNLYGHIAELHGFYAGDFADYLKRRADRTFGDEPNNLTDPPGHSPNPNPFSTNPSSTPTDDPI